jgi:hypothetical protein
MEVQSILQFLHKEKLVLRVLLVLLVHKESKEFRENRAFRVLQVLKEIKEILVKDSLFIKHSLLYPK